MRILRFQRSLAGLALLVAACTEGATNEGNTSEAIETEVGSASGTASGESEEGDAEGQDAETAATESASGASAGTSQGGTGPETGATTSGGTTLVEPGTSGNTGTGGTTTSTSTTEDGESSDAMGGEESSGDEGNHDSPCPREETEKHKEIVRAGMTRVMIQGGASRDDILMYWDADTYIQHNPIAPNGVDAFIGFFENGAPNSYTMTRLIGECDKVVLHGRYGSGATFDMLRVDPERERMVEHWDAGGGSLDGETEVRDLELTGANREVVLGFIDDVLIAGNLGMIGNYIAADMVEHGGGTGGADGFAQRIMSENMSYVMVHHQVAEGNFVFTLSEGHANNNHLGFHDLFRVEDGMIVEHWVASLAVQDGVSGEGIF